MSARRNVTGVILIVVGVALATVSMAALAGDAHHSPVALGTISGLLAVVAFAFAWLQMLDGGTPIDRVERPVERRQAPRRAPVETASLAEEAAEP